jgi:hypothetical protein
MTMWLFGNSMVCGDSAPRVPNAFVSCSKHAATVAWGPTPCGSFFNSVQQEMQLATNPALRAYSIVQCSTAGRTLCGVC